LGESTQLREALIDLDSITSKLSYWANVEALFLGTMRNAIWNKFKPLESDLVRLYIEILRLEVEMVNWASDGGIGMNDPLSMLDLRLSHNKSARVFKTLERAVIWRDLVKKISNYHEVCKSTFDRCKMESDQHAKVKKWISEYRPEQAHDDALQRTGVAQKYRTCGQWLLDDARFTSWSSPELTPNCQILWLRGTGKYNLQMLAKMLIVNSRYRKVDTIVSISKNSTEESRFIRLQSSNHPMASGQSFFIPRSPICILLLLQRCRYEL
jgi:hypothetical protein